jgi:hypothetical protein
MHDRRIEASGAVGEPDMARFRRDGLLQQPLDLVDQRAASGLP